MEHPISYRTVKVDGLSIFYREAGPKDAPAILLLARPSFVVAHVSASTDAARRRLPSVAPDYPGFGHSDWPDPKQFGYTFDHIASVMDGFTRSPRPVDATRSTCRTTAGRSAFA